MEHLAYLREVLNVLYEDSHTIAVLKPAGMLTQGDASGKFCLMDLVKDYLREKYQKKGRVFLGLVHRLDKRVRGIVLFGKTSKGASRLSKQLRDRTFQKEYHAVVEGMVSERSRVLEHFLRARKGVGVEVFDKPQLEAKLSRLTFLVVKRLSGRSVLKIELETGRKHQIRAQLSAIGHPIVGDKLYGASQALGELALVATCLRWKHPTNHEWISIRLPNAQWKLPIN